MLPCVTQPTRLPGDVCADKPSPLRGCLLPQSLASFDALEVWMRHDRGLNVGGDLVVVAVAVPLASARDGRAACS